MSNLPKPPAGGAIQDDHLDPTVRLGDCTPKAVVAGTDRRASFGERVPPKGLLGVWWTRIAPSDWTVVATREARVKLFIASVLVLAVIVVTGVAMQSWQPVATEPSRPAPQTASPVGEPERRAALTAPMVGPTKPMVEPAAPVVGATAPMVGASDRGDGGIEAQSAGYAEIIGNVTKTLQVFRYAGNSNILVLDFPSLREQGPALNRIATLIEKQGTPRDRILSTAELQSYIRSVQRTPDTLYFGHNYRAFDMVRFFNLADKDNVALNEFEKKLRQILLDHGFMIRANADYEMVKPEKALVSVVQEQSDDPTTPQSELVDARLRNTIFRHELSHGEFITNQAYREYCEYFWRERMSEPERDAFRRFLATREYDAGNEQLVINEMQAFLMHTPNETVFNAASLGVTTDQLESLQQRFIGGAPPTRLFKEAAAAMATTVSTDPQ